MNDSFRMSGGLQNKQKRNVRKHVDMTNSINTAIRESIGIGKERIQVS